MQPQKVHPSICRLQRPYYCIPIGRCSFLSEGFHIQAAPCCRHRLLAVASENGYLRGRELCFQQQTNAVFILAELAQIDKTVVEKRIDLRKLFVELTPVIISENFLLRWRIEHVPDTTIHVRLRHEAHVLLLLPGVSLCLIIPKTLILTQLQTQQLLSLFRIPYIILASHALHRG